MLCIESAQNLRVFADDTATTASTTTTTTAATYGYESNPVQQWDWYP
jgi:hypothetical protein